jgi:hypothetical protein
MGFFRVLLLASAVAFLAGIAGGMAWWKCGVLAGIAASVCLLFRVVDLLGERMEARRDG